MDEKYRETLEKQLHLLSECSMTADDTCLDSITLAMLEIFKYLSQPNR